MVDRWTLDLRQSVQALALQVGFDCSGIVAFADETAGVDALEAERFSAWIEEGRAGEMEYLKRRDAAGVLLRSEVRIAMPWARSALICALNYNTTTLHSLDHALDSQGWIARYAWTGREQADSSIGSTDYHGELLVRLRRLESLLQQQTSCETRCYVDTGPIVERALAARAGIGWIGKNTCVINQQLGSWLLLGVIVTSLPVESSALDLPAADRCGSCTRCIEACPTDALIAPRQMDASRCIAYLTIEKKGSIPTDLRSQMGRQVFGCDICQDVCPWNRRAPIAVKEGMQARTELINPHLATLAQMDASEFRRLFKGSPVERTRRKRLLRNVAVAMGNSGDEQFVPRLQEWSESEDEILAETATWAMKRIRDLSAEKGRGTMIVDIV